MGRKTKGKQGEDKEDAVLTGGTPGRTYAHELFHLNGLSEGDVDDATRPVVAYVPSGGNVDGRRDLQEVVRRDVARAIRRNVSEGIGWRREGGRRTR